jgi:hypothetical protein
MESLKREIPFLKMREAGVKPEKPREPPKKTKPMIIAKNEQMKKVLGLGYPSAPIYTVEEFGDRQVEIMEKQAKNLLNGYNLSGIEIGRYHQGNSKI